MVAEVTEPHGMPISHIVSNNQTSFEETKTLMKDRGFEETKTLMKDRGVYVKTSETIDTLYLLSNDDFNGLILEKETNNVICMTNQKFKKIERDTVAQFNQIETLKKESSDFKIEYCEDGTVIRLYNYKGTWYTATSKCLDANLSFWGSNKSFAEMFWETFANSDFMFSLENGLDSLDPSYTYVFILFHTENRIVVKHNSNSLMYIKRINNQTGQEDNTNTDIKQLHIQTDEINYPLDSYFTDNKRGLLIKFYKSNGSYETYQYDFQQYVEIKNLRGNVPYIRTRILELVNDPESLKMLKLLYSEHILSFAMVENSLNNLYKDIHKLYIESHIKHHIQIYESHPLYKTLKQLHGQYKTRITEDPNYIITIEEVKNKVNQLDKYVLSKLLGWVN